MSVNTVCLIAFCFIHILHTVSTFSKRGYRYLTELRGLLNIISTFKCLFTCSEFISFPLIESAANVANLNLFRFAGRPGKYNKLFNRWRLEEVSAVRHLHKWSDHCLLFQVIYRVFKSFIFLMMCLYIRTINLLHNYWDFEF